mmetsp:Transcript_25551/g.66902  ORF Transcript_25551/g.66902 Transcript_25551/m.66902 type:complete len:235 (+) Transcript_25551:950-1654(+)
MHLECHLVLLLHLRLQRLDELGLVCRLGPRGAQFGFELLNHVGVLALHHGNGLFECRVGSPQLRLPPTVVHHRGGRVVGAPAASQLGPQLLDLGGQALLLGPKSRLVAFELPAHLLGESLLLAGVAPHLLDGSLVLRLHHLAVHVEAVNLFAKLVGLAVDLPDQLNQRVRLGLEHCHVGLDHPRVGVHLGEKLEKRLEVHPVPRQRRRVRLGDCLPEHFGKRCRPELHGNLGGD